MTPEQCELLTKIAAGQHNFGNDDIRDEGAKLEAEHRLEQLKELASMEYITLKIKRASMAHDNPLYGVNATITEGGQRALVDECASESKPPVYGTRVEIGKRRQAGGTKDSL